jgi:hypothetical protein
LLISIAQTAAYETWFFNHLIYQGWDGIKIGLQTRYGTFGDSRGLQRCARFCYATSEFNLIAKTAARLTVFRIATGSPLSATRSAENLANI